MTFEFPAGSSIESGEYIVLAFDSSKYSGRGFDVYQWDSGTLKNGGEKIQLSDANGNELDLVDYDDERGWTSIPDGEGPSLELPDASSDNDNGGNWRESAADGGSPGKVNTDARLASPEFSLEGGFYDGTQTITIKTSVSGAKIGYTTDGSEPSNNFGGSQISITLSKSTSVRARVYKSGLESSSIITHTYLIGEDTSLPVISISSNPDDFYGSSEGIFTNYNEETYKTINVEFFDSSRDIQFNQIADVKVHGNVTRSWDVKSLVLKARKSFGVPTLNYPFFRDREEDEFKNVIIRGMGNDQRGALMRDALAQGIVEGRMDVDSQGSRPVIMYLNGEWVGIRYIRDRMNNDFPDTYYGLDDDDITIQNWYLLNDIRSYVSSHDMSQASSLNGISQLMDIDESINYYIAEIFSGNHDWPGNNSKAWRDTSTNSPWRWMMYDMDTSFGLGNEVDNNTFHTATSSTGAAWPNPPHSTEVFIGLLKNKSFREEFTQRFMSHVNSTYAVSRVNPIIDRFAAEINGDVTQHLNKWADKSLGYTTQNYGDWQEAVQEIRDYLVERPGLVRSQLLSYFSGKGDTSGYAVLTVENSLPYSGKVMVNGVEMLPQSSVSGEWFKSIPMTLKAVPGEGETFLRWEGAVSSTNEEITLSLSGDKTIKAVFSGVTPEVPELVVSEIHYNPLNSNEEFAEVYNAGTASVDLSGYTTDGFDFTFPQGTSIAVGEVIVLAIDETAYSSLGVQVFQWTDGKLSNGGEEVALIDSTGTVVDSVTYDDGGDWPGTPDGDGYSLELQDMSSDNAVADSWAASSAIGGSPGAI